MRYTNHTLLSLTHLRLEILSQTTLDTVSASWSVLIRWGESQKMHPEKFLKSTMEDLQTGLEGFSSHSLEHDMVT